MKRVRSHMEGRFYKLSRNIYLKPSVVLFVIVFVGLNTSEVFLGKEIIYQLEEEVPIGTKLADIMTDAGLTKLYKPQEIRKMTLRFNADPVIPLFIKNGIVRTGGRIDREGIPACRLRDPCELSVDVTVQPYEYFRVIKLIVEILDINDHSPTFQTADDRDTAEISILESVSQGSSVVLPSASDLDSPRYGIAGYQLLMVAGMTAFHLKVTMKVEGILEAGLVVNEKLDRETIPFYTATLVAYDGGTPTRSTSLNLMIIVLDANDNDPTFEKSYYEAKIPESAKFNQTVVYLKARDDDHGKNAEIRYSLAAQSPHNPIDSFGIDERSGRLFVKTPLDRETNDKSQLVVSARDLGVYSRQTNVLVTLRVEDVNDNSPEISINSLSLVASNAASVPENVSPGTFVAHLTTVDRDLGENGTVQCYLQNHRTGHEILTVAENTSRDIENELFHLSKQKLTFVSGEEEYHLLTSANLDRELVQKYKVHIACNDHGLPPLTSYATVDIIVTDENDNTPIFKLPEYVATIPENSIPGSVVTRVTATDPDAERNGQVSYRTSGPLAEYFDIDVYGNIILSQHLSREKLTHKLEVNAVDHGEPRRTGTTFVMINISGDLLLANSTFFFRVTENQQPGTLVGKIIPEEDRHLNFEINGFDDAQWDAFVLDQQTGFIKTGKVLDREIQPVYHFWIQQVPSDNKTFQSRDSKKTSVTIFMEDVNDNDPLFVFPSPNNFTVVVASKNLKTEALIARVSAVDGDSGKNAEIEYKLKDCVQSNTLQQDQFHLTDWKTKIQNKSTTVWANSTIRHDSNERNATKSESQRGMEDCEIFRVDPNLGNVHIRKRPESNADLSYQLVIVAVDKGDPVRSTLALLTVVVNNTNAVKRHTSLPISGRTMVVLGFISGTLLVVGILTVLIISVIFFKRYFRRRPDKPPNQIDPPIPPSVKDSSDSTNSLISINLPSISSTLRLLTSCFRRETRNNSQDDLLRRSVPCIQLNMDQNSSKLLEQTECQTDATNFCNARSPLKHSFCLRSSDERDSRMANRNRSMEKKFDSMSYFSLESSDHQGDARFSQSNWKQKFLNRYPQTFESSGYQNREVANNNNNNNVEITPYLNHDNSIQSSSDRKVIFRREDDGQEKHPRERRAKQIERLTPPPPAQLPPHVLRQLNDSRHHYQQQQNHKRLTKEDKKVSMNVERHKMLPFRLSNLRRIEESEII